jgi:Transposase domain (DUF772)
VNQQVQRPAGLVELLGAGAGASVLQFSENLTGRQAAEAVRDRITWKYALGLELDDPGLMPAC